MWKLNTMGRVISGLGSFGEIPNETVKCQQRPMGVCGDGAGKGRCLLGFPWEQLVFLSADGGFFAHRCAVGPHCGDLPGGWRWNRSLRGRCPQEQRWGFCCTNGAGSCICTSIPSASWQEPQLELTESPGRRMSVSATLGSPAGRSFGSGVGGLSSTASPREAAGSPALEMQLDRAGPAWLQQALPRKAGPWGPLQPGVL